MGKVSINTVKNWFKTSFKPTQAQFWDLFDSYWHKDEKIGLENILGFSDLYDQKADDQVLSGHINDANAHGVGGLRDKIQGLEARVSDLEVNTLAPINKTGADVDEDGFLDLSFEQPPNMIRQPVVYVDDVAGEWQTQYNKSTKVITGLYGIPIEAKIEIIF